LSDVKTELDLLFSDTDSLAMLSLDLLFEAHPELRASYDERKTRLAREDMGHHIRNLAVAAVSGRDEFLSDYLAWLTVLFQGIPIPPDLIRESFLCIGKASSRYLSPAAAASFSFYTEKAARLYGHGEPAANRYLKEGLPDNGIARAYVQALLDGRRDLASSLVEGELRSGKTVRELYLDLFQPCQREIGRLWHTRRISVAQEHFATAATQFIMSGLYPRLAASARPNGKKLVAACAQGELHELGLRMVADFFQADGWDTRYFGADLPMEALIDEINRVKPDLVALSAAVPVNLRWISRAVERIKSTGESAPAVMVGGIPFIVTPDLWKDVGADASGGDCDAAVRVGARLVGLSQ
jgi:MerR family transcriptional regulator, light-induced transcriptional regulator